MKPQGFRPKFPDPPIDINKQHRPTVTDTEVGALTTNAAYRFAVLFALLAGTGLRAGEALALKPTDFSPDFRVLKVTRSIWHGREQDPKTPAAVREIDIAEPLAALLRVYAEGKAGYLFATKSGRPLEQRNVNRAAGVGLHAFPAIPYRDPSPGSCSRGPHRAVARSRATFGY